MHADETKLNYALSSFKGGGVTTFISELLLHNGGIYCQKSLKSKE